MKEAGRMKGYGKLENRVIHKGLCTGCGTCIGACPGGFLGINWLEGDAEPYLAKPECNNCGVCVRVCPGKDIPLLDLEEMVFGRRRDPAKDWLGVYQKAFIAHAAQVQVRQAGAAGGVGSALLAYALDAGLIEGALVAGFNPQIPFRAEGRIVTDSGELTRHARSKHGGNPPINAILSEAVLHQGISKLGAIGCPCHVHGLRKIQKHLKTSPIAKSIRIVLGLFCASQGYFEATRHILSEYCGVYDLNEIVSLDYRLGKWPGRFYVKTKSGREVLVDRHEYVYHFLLYWQRDRCLVCLDHCAELADIALGDYWSPEMKAGDAGWNLVIARSDLGLDLLEDAEKKGYIVKKETDFQDKIPSGTQFKKRRNPFYHKRRQRYGIPVPDYGFTLGHEPGKARKIHRAPSFTDAVVEETGPGK